MKRLLMLAALVGGAMLLGVGLLGVGWLGAGVAAAQAGQTTDLGIQANELVRDPAGAFVYATVDAGDPTHGNSVVKLDAATGAVVAKVAVGADPNALAISADGTKLFVGLDGEPKVQRIDVATLTVDLDIPLGLDGDGEQLFARDLAAMPGAPASFAIAFVDQGTRDEGVAVYDGATRRPAIADEFDVTSIAFGPGPGAIYASDTDGSPRFFRAYDVDATGVTHRTTVSGLTNAEAKRAVGTLLYTDGLEVIDISGATPSLAGTFPANPFDFAFGASGDFLPATGTFFTLRIRALAGNDQLVVDEFDPGSFTHVRGAEVGPTDSRNEVVQLLPVARETHFGIVDGFDGPNQLLLIRPGGTIAGTVTDRFTGAPIEGLCADVWTFGGAELVAETLTDAAGSFRAQVAPGTYEVLYFDCAAFEYSAEFFGIDRVEPVVVPPFGSVGADFSLLTTDLFGLVDVTAGEWHLSRPRESIVHSFLFGNPGDVPMMGDWDCNGTDTPGLYRQSDGFVYLRNSNTTGIADIRFFFGNPGDLPLAGDFNGDGCDTVSIYRPSQSQIFVINKLGANDGGLGAAETDYFFGNPGDKPYVGDFDFDGVDTVGLHRESTGLVYYRNTHTQGPAEEEFIFGDPGDRIVAGNFSGIWIETPAIFRPADRVFYVRHTNSQGNADRTQTWNFATDEWLPVAGKFGL